MKYIQKHGRGESVNIFEWDDTDISEAFAARYLWRPNIAHISSFAIALFTLEICGRRVCRAKYANRLRCQFVQEFVEFGGNIKTIGDFVEIGTVRAY